ncbi:MAG: hypothetical protein ABL982_03500 [Vicinamibacterales bacterium]
MRVFVDLDGVLADFDTRYADVFGERNDHNGPEPPDFWDRLGAHADGHFYAELPVMPDARALWDGVIALCSPIVLTGIPRSLPHAEPDKRAWVARHFGDDVPVNLLRLKGQAPTRPTRRRPDRRLGQVSASLGGDGRDVHPAYVGRVECGGAGGYPPSAGPAA